MSSPSSHHSDTHSHGHEWFTLKKGLAKVFAPLARTWQWVQNKVANVLGFKNANTASATVGVAGATGMAVANVLGGPVGSVAYGAGWWLFVTGVFGLLENHFTKKVAESDGGGSAAPARAHH